MVEFGITDVTDGFREVMGLKVVRGRWFSREDAITEIVASRERFSSDGRAPHLSNPTEAN